LFYFSILNELDAKDFFSTNPGVPKKMSKNLTNRSIGTEAELISV
jgi:hypothetical protein